MIETSTHVGISAADPTILVKPSNNGYTVTAVPSTSLAARLGSAALFLFCLTFLAAGVFVWFAPDSAFSGNPLTLKLIVSGATWLIFLPILYFNFFNTTTMVAEVSTRERKIHQIFLDKDGRETKRRSFAFSGISDLELLSNTTNSTDDPRDMTSLYGQIQLRISSRKGTSLVWGAMDDLRPVFAKMQRDVFAGR